jgi:hypothetical protein
MHQIPEREERGKDRNTLEEIITIPPAGWKL